jgi:uncharacterized membrane protein YeaQ/YmgE (transglycosylase-associated protein family)
LDATENPNCFETFVPLFGGWLMSMIGKTGVTDFNWYSFWVAVLGAVILNLILKIARG